MQGPQGQDQQYQSRHGHTASLGGTQSNVDVSTKPRHRISASTSHIGNPISQQPSTAAHGYYPALAVASAVTSPRSAAKHNPAFPPGSPGSIQVTTGSPRATLHVSTGSSLTGGSAGQPPNSPRASMLGPGSPRVPSLGPSNQPMAYPQSPKHTMSAAPATQKPQQYTHVPAPSTDAAERLSSAPSTPSLQSYGNTTTHTTPISMASVNSIHAHGTPLPASPQGLLQPVYTPPGGGYMHVTYQDVHLWMANLSLDDGRFQEGARNLSQYATFGEPSTIGKLLVGHDLSILVKALDSKKRLCGSKQAAMDTIARFVYIHDSYRNEFLTKGSVSALVKNLKCDQVRCQLNAVAALHALVYTGKRDAASREDSHAILTSPPPVVLDEKKKGVSGLFKKSKLARQVNRLVIGTQADDMATQITDAAGVEALVMMLSGSDNVQQMAVDILLDIAGHDDRIHHLAKRGTVEGAVQLLKPSNGPTLQLKGLNLLVLLTQPRQTKMEKGLLEGNVEKALASSVLTPLLNLLNSEILELSCKAAEVTAALGNTSDNKSNLARNGNCVHRLLGMLEETPQHKASALLAIEQLSRDPAGSVQRVMAEMGGVLSLLRLVKPEEACLETVMTCLRLLANTNEHRLHLIETGAIPMVLNVTSLTRDTAVLTEASTLMWYLSPYQNAATGTSYVVEAGGIKALVGYMACPKDDCKAAACRALTVLASQNDDNKDAIVKEGALQVLIHMMQGPSLDIRGIAAEVIVELAEKDEYKVSIAQLGAIRDLVVMLTDHPELSINAAARAIEKLSSLDANRWEVVATHGLPPLVHLLSHPTACGPAVRTLLSIAANQSFLTSIAAAKAVPLLTKLGVDPTCGCDDVALHVLRLLCTVPESLDVVAGTKGTIAALVQVMATEAPSLKMKQDALEAILMITHVPHYRHAAVADGAIHGVIRLLHNDKWPAKAAAAQVVSNLAAESEANQIAIITGNPMLRVGKMRLAFYSFFPGLSVPVHLNCIGSGGIGPLKQLLFHGDDVEKAAAADALGQIAYNNTKGQGIVASDGVIARLVTMLSSSHIPSRMASTAALYHVTKGNQPNQLEAVAKGAVHQVITSLNQSKEDSCPEMKELMTWSAYAVSSLACNNEVRKEMANLNAVNVLASMLMDDSVGANGADISTRNAAGIALASLVAGVPDIQSTYIHTGTLPVVIGMLTARGEQITSVLVACHLLTACAGNPNLYACIDVLQTCSLLMDLVHSKNARVQDAAIRTLCRMAESNPAAKQQVSHHVGQFVKLLSDKQIREAACQTLRILAATDPEVRGFILKNKSACKTIQKLTEKTGTVIQDEAIKLWRTLAGEGAQ